MPPPPPRAMRMPLPIPRNQDAEEEATPSGHQDASEENHSETSRADDTVSPEEVEDSLPKFPLRQGELPPALPDDMVNLTSSVS